MEGSSWNRAKFLRIGPLDRLAFRQQAFGLPGPAAAMLVGSHCSMPVLAGKFTSMPGSPTVDEDRKNSSYAQSVQSCMGPVCSRLAMISEPTPPEP